MFLMRKIYLFLLPVFCFLLVNTNTFGQVGVQNIKICVISDMHYFDSTLLISDGPAFQTYLSYDRKLLKESHAIAVSAVDSLIAENPDLVLITGDMTKDGENINHQRVAGLLQKMENLGIMVMVVPGNHDINNPDAMQFDNDTAYPVPSVSPAEFATIYNPYGRDLAGVTDTASLSYLAEPIAGLQILAMDLCRYDSNYAFMTPVVSGGYKPHVLQWAFDRIDEAKQSGKVMICMQHHNLMEHFTGQKSVFSDYIIDDYDTVSGMLADRGLKVVLSGHFHAQDIVQKTTPQNNTIYDIETGSLVSYPCPYRILNLTTDTILHITGKRVQSIDYNTDTMSFQEYALQNIQNGLPFLIIYMLSNPPFGIDSSLAAMVAPAISESLIAHYGGNEGSPTPATQSIINLMVTVYPSIGNIVAGIWNDPAPDDWTTEIDLGYSTTVGVQDIVNISDVLLFPNPSAGVFALFLPESKNQTRISVFDMKGNLVYLRNVETDRLIDVNISGNPCGQYLLQLEMNGVRMSKKIIIK